VDGIFCNQCGHGNPAGSNFCSSCGGVLERGDDPATSMITLTPIESAGEVAEEEVHVSIDDFPAGVGLLVVKRGPNAGSRFLLGHALTTIGRQPDSDIFLDDVTVSRRHAEITATPEGFVARDVGSLNGTYLNRERMEEATLANGDELQVGKFRLVFLAEVPRGQSGA
jgi:hypothetical protein